MKNNQNKVISIRLVDIIGILILISFIVVAINKSKSSKEILEISKLEENNQIAARNVDISSARHSDTERDNSDKENEEVVENNITENELENSNAVSDDQIDKKEQEDSTEKNGETEQEGQTNQTEEVKKENLNEHLEIENQEEKQENNVESNQKEEIKYISLEEVTISEKMDLTICTGLSKDDFIKLISGVKQDSSKFFYDNAGIIYDLCQKYSINEIFFCGIISAESGWNIASNHRSTYNYISLMVNGKLKKFSSVEDGLEQAAKTLHNNYLTPGGRFYYGKTLSAVKTKFCPSSSTWTSLVYGRMKQIVNSK